MRVFITGITGTLGTAIAKLHHKRGDQIWGCARNEANICRWLIENPKMATIFVDDARNLDEPSSDQCRSLKDCDVCYHCAAMKHVDLCEQNQYSAWYENVLIPAIVSSTCKELGIRLVFSSSDKACLPQSVYGATKLSAERLVASRGGAVVRLGNLIGSSGSVFSKWVEQISKGHRPKITHMDMTRYFIPVQSAAKFMVEQGIPGKITIPEMKSTRMGTIITKLGMGYDEIGLRPGETLNQWLVAPGDRIEKDNGKRMILGEGDVCETGMNSETAEQWDAYDLLGLAGLNL
jgi:FlaA1/EpsC-like NDP-sugar epimerase